LFKELAKHLATYYTAVTSARVLAALALGAPEADWSDKDLSDIDEVRKLRIADFACGSGTLLSAVHHELERLHSNACYENDRSSNLTELHKVLMDDVIEGYDVMLYAAHIATITLAMHNPDAIFKEGHIFVLPFGGKDKNTGSLEFLVRDRLFVRTTAIRMDIKGRREIELKPPEAGFDLLIMNPPFARSCGDNLLFGSETDDDTRTAMQARLSDMLAESGLNGIGHAGLGAAFVGLANRFVKPGGRVAFVLPRNLLSGVSWRKIRDLLMGLLPQKTPHLACYNLEYVLLNTEPPSFSFSENTDLSECMFIARKLKPGEMPLNTIFILLNGRPKTVFSASELVKAIMGYERKGTQGRALDIFLNPNGKPATIEVGTEDMGKIYAAPAEIVEGNTDNWGRLCAYAVPELTKIAYRLRDKGEFGVSKAFTSNIVLKPFVNMFEVGVDRRQIHDSFKLSDRGTYKALWGKEIGMNSLSIEPNMRLARQTGADVATISNTRSRLLIAERIRLDTTPLISVLCTEPVLSNVWWTAKSKATDGNSDALQKAMALWLNSTPGLLLLFSELQITQGAWTAIKKTPLEALLALDLDSLEHDKLQAIASLFDSSDSDEFPVLPTQFQEAAHGGGWRHKLDSELLGILSGEQIPNDALRPLYELLIEETKHW
ncbi:MAG TPA: hypothetical protein VJ521_08170, partial [Acidobacteriota bacterium]|nr:hypothetical protein [Acidobacteriota bacterium]